MNTFLIDPRGNGGDSFTVEAADYGAAAQAAANKLFPSARAHIYRETGDPSGAGMFEAYRRMKTPEHVENSVGNPFHVLEL